MRQGVNSKCVNNKSNKFAGHPFDKSLHCAPRLISHDNYRKRE